MAEWVVVRHADCHVGKSEALRYLGYSGQERSAEFDARFDRMAAACEESSRPAWCYRVFELDLAGDEARLRGSTVTFRIEGSTEPFRKARSCAVMACTLGLANEREARRLAAIDAIDALIFDAASSSLVEACADACEKAIHAAAEASGLSAGQRVSPGYGALPLGLQTVVVRTLDAGKLLGVSVAGGDLLIPLKSVTALVGLFERESDARQARRSCADCVVSSDCAYLKAGNPCNEEIR